MNNSRTHQTPFAYLGHTKSAGFFGDIKDSVWNSTMKPLGNSVGQIASGVGKMGQGFVEGAGNLVETPMRALKGMAQGGMDAAVKGYQTNGRVDLGGAMQGAIDGGWNAGKKSLSASGDGIMKNWQGAGDVVSGLASTAYNANPLTLAARGVSGAASGAVTGAENFLNDKLKSLVPPAPATPAAPTPAAAAAPTPAAPAAVAAPKPAVTAPAVTSAPAPAPQPAIPTAPAAGPSAGQLAQFKTNHATPYDPNSRMDRGKMQTMAQPARAQGPSAAQLAQFKRQHGSAYDPNSKLDRGKMQAGSGPAFQQLAGR